MPPKFKPGGRKFPPKITASVPGSPAATSSSSAVSTAENVLDPESEDRFEIELYWCVQQLQTALDSGKLNERQSLDTTKTLNVLKSSTAPLVKKRQFMRTTFGDYRTKMLNDEKKLAKNSSQVKFSLASSLDKNLNGGSCKKKSLFIKKANSNTNSTENSSFNFNFKHPEDEI